jgi:hypothetical protein
MRLAPAYLDHCRQHPDTLLSYLGCHSIRLPFNTRKVYFVVMHNVLPCKPDLCFDLKGATSNRQRARGAAQRALLSGARPASSFATLLDKDWMAMGLTLNLSPQRKQALRRTLAADCTFMMREDLLDYSLLLGVVLPGGHERARGDWLTGEGGETYFLGIIDVLERWGGLRWKVQGSVLRCFFRYVMCSKWYNPEGITAVPPEPYALRFEEFFHIHVLGLPPEARREGAKSWHPFW